MAVEMRLPKLSDAMSEATISRWLKGVGDSVDKGEPLVEVETEKVIVEVEAPRAGVIVEIVAPEQSVVAVDAVLCRIGTPGERPVRANGDAATEPRPAAAAPAARPPAQAAAAQAPASNVVNLPPREPAPPPDAAPGTGGALASGGGVAASPLARRVADELGIDLLSVQGTGIGGKIVMADLQPYLQPGSAAPQPAAPTQRSAPSPAPRPAPALPAVATEQGYQDVPLAGLRRTIARRMAEAKGAIPHFYMSTEADVTDLLAVRERLNAGLATGRISVTALLVKAIALALGKVPALNATWHDDAVRRYAGVHLGLATALDDGLVTPVLRDCHLKTVGRIAQDAEVLVDKARRRALGAEDLQGGTFTLSNLGMYDVTAFAAILNPPQVGILAVARPVQRPAAHEGQVALRSLVTATLSADHRAVDGVTGAEFLGAFKAVLEHPERLML